MGRPKKLNNQHNQRRQARHDKAKARPGTVSDRWDRYTINLRRGSELSMTFQTSMNKSEMVRRVFAKNDIYRSEIIELRRELEDVKAGYEVWKGKCLILMDELKGEEE